MSYRDHAGVQT